MSGSVALATETFRSVAFAHVARHGSSSDGQGDEQGCMHKRTQPNELAARVLTQDFFGLARRVESEEGSVCKYMTDRANNATKPGRKRTSQKSFLGYMVKRLSAHGGCLGSKRR